MLRTFKSKSEMIKLVHSSPGQALLIAAAAVAARFVVPDQISALILLGINAIVVLGLVLFMGYAGQVSLGHAAFFGIGAYTAAITSTRYGWNPWLGIAAAMAASCITALIIGKPSLRLRGHYLAMATLGFGEIVYALMNQLKPLTNGSDGISGIPSLSLGSFAFDSKESFYYLVWLIVAFSMFFCVNMVRSRVGRALRSIHGSEIAAEAMGIDTSKYKIEVLALSAAFAGLAGALFSYYMSFISPESFTVTTSVVFVTMVVVGGMHSLWGGIVGAGALTLLEEYLRDYQEYSLLIYGALLTAIVIFAPNGLVGSLKTALSYARGRYIAARSPKKSLEEESAVTRSEVSY